MLVAGKMVVPITFVDNWMFLPQGLMTRHQFDIAIVAKSVQGAHQVIILLGIRLDYSLLTPTIEICHESFHLSTNYPAFCQMTKPILLFP